MEMEVSHPALSTFTISRDYEDSDNINPVLKGTFSKGSTWKRRARAPKEKRVDEYMNNLLSKVFTASEVKTALFQMKPLGSPGPDGFPAVFYQNHWDIVGVDVTRAVLEILNSTGDMSCLISKVLANRLKLILPQIISPTQSAFVSGRLILDNVIVAFVAMHSMSCKIKGLQGYMSLKLDMSKAYDRVEWSFLRAAMDKMGFSSRWIDLVMRYDSLLFCRANGADDSLLFCRANGVEWVKLIHLLDLYEKGSGQKLNKDKTSIFFSANTRRETRDYIISMAGLRATSSYEKHLGLPVLIGRSRIQAFKGILDRVRARMSNWKNKLLSQAGKEVLLKAIIQALPTYCMRVFKLSKALISELNRVMHNFWWGQQERERKTHWVSWHQMGKAKSIGGLGFREFESFNNALLAKQALRIIQKPLSLASQVLKMKYFPTTKFLKAKVGGTPSFIWRSIYSARHLIEKGSIWRIGNGQSTLIWQDRWLPIPSSSKVQSVSHILPRDAKVASIINHTLKEWKKDLVKEMFGEAEADTINKIPINSTVKSAYHLQKELNAVRYGQSSSAVNKKIEWINCWNFQIPNAVKTFLWRACLESLPTRFNLAKKQICESSKCPICLSEIETVIHILRNCPSAMDVWSQGQFGLQKRFIRPENFGELLEALISTCDQYTIELFALTTAKKYLKEFKDAQPKINTSSRGMIEEDWLWNPPPLGVTKINWDAGLNAGQGRAGFILYLQKLKVLCML
ncbi:hypothetical protein F2P56_020324 [Juglans regia]|uniref:Reverse transcriptase n=2 Tax=Juglans regia TaxID=51240 RepID=A0A833U2G8_JUGRE|nr:uncharacterized protein LOC108981439 [Juglans regia]KAF5460460.1 hypothetical protein F2P56_020324 [Juglans regia]